MKLYTFIKKPDEDMIHDDSIMLNVKYSLYAITAIKDDAKTFRKSRNMDLFIEREVEIDDEDCDEYMLHHRGHILSYYWLQSYRDKNTDNQTPYWINILMTENELNFTIETTDSGSILNRISNFIPIDIFVGKVKKSLYKLKYDKATQLVLAMTASERLDFNAPYEGDIWDTGLSFDMFAIFMILYQSTFSTDFFTFTKITYDQPREDIFP